MCGIIGIVAKSSVNQALYDGLTVLQHRGHGDVKRPVERVWKLRYFAAREACRGKQVSLHLGRVFPMGDTRRDC